MNIRQSASTLNPELSPTELDAIRTLVRKHPKEGAHLEIGTAAGGTLRELLLCYSEPRPKFVVVDPFTYFPNQLEIVKRNLREAGLDEETVEFREDFSWPLCKKALKNGDRFDFIFIDGHHGPHYVMRDFRWTRMLQVNGFVCLHDYRPNFPGVIWAIEYFLKKNQNYTRIAHVDSLVILQKNSAGKPEADWLDLLAGEAIQKWMTLKNSVKKKLRRVGLI